MQAGAAEPALAVPVAVAGCGSSVVTVGLEALEAAVFSERAPTAKTEIREAVMGRAQAAPGGPMVKPAPLGQEFSITVATSPSSAITSALGTRVRCRYLAGVLTLSMRQAELC